MKYEKFDLIFYILVLALLLVLAAAAANGQTSSGGAYTLTKTVVAGGGRDAQNAPVSVSATAGQSIAGRTSIGGQFSLYSGFWTPETFAPTASNVTVGGRVKSSAGKGIRNVIVTITFPSGEQRTVLSGSLGYYRFAEIPAGETYIFSAAAKRYTFTQPTQIISILEDTQNIDFIANASQVLTSEITPQ